MNRAILILKSNADPILCIYTNIITYCTVII